MSASAQPQQNSVDVLIHRVAALPVPAAVISQANQLYHLTKESNRLFNYTFNLAEGTVQYAVQKAAPVYGAFNGPINSVGTIAVKSLDSVEKNFPSVKKTPEELWEDYKRLSETNKVVKTVDLARVAAIYGIDKVQSTTKYATDVVTGVKQKGQDTVATTLRTGLRVVNGVFDGTESLIDKYLIPAGNHSEQNGVVYDYGKHDDLGAINRISQISNKFSAGLKARASHTVANTKTYAHDTIQQLQQTVLLLEQVKKIPQWAKENENLNQAQQQAIKLWNGIKAHAEQAKKDPESVVVEVVKQWASGSDYAFGQLLHLTRPYLPAALLAPATSTSSFLHHLSANFAKATHLSEIKDEVIVHAREQLAGVEDLLMRVVDLASNLPAAKWVVKISENHLSNGYVSHDKANGHHKAQ